ncbi:hypothetical protein [Shewanella gelidii]|uniref:hypothetical protein n=1 Tax=Shewanella gelidii TaxID=1642821 RepID=UPI0024B18B38|nr:hypothetical protein [Shewanella gelidii]
MQTIKRQWLICHRVACALLLVIVSPNVAAGNVEFSSFCQALAGHWQGASARANQSPKLVRVESVCSADQRQLLLSVSRSARHQFSETWWFRIQGEQIKLTYFDGVDEDKQQMFTLYGQRGDFSLVGEGELNHRPALIQLRFDRKQQGWTWLQNAQYLDDDAERYLFFRGIEMQPFKQP